MNREIIETRHGTVSYEIAECENCDTEMKKENAVHFALQPRKSGIRIEASKEGHLCEYCAETLLGFNSRVRRREVALETVNHNVKELDPIIITLLVCGGATVFGMVVALLI